MRHIKWSKSLDNCTKIHTFYHVVDHQARVAPSCIAVVHRAFRPSPTCLSSCRSPVWPSFGLRWHRTGKLSTVFLLSILSIFRIAWCFILPWLDATTKRAEGWWAFSALWIYTRTANKENKRETAIWCTEYSTVVLLFLKRETWRQSGEKYRGEKNKGIYILYIGKNSREMLKRIFSVVWFFFFLFSLNSRFSLHVCVCMWMRVCSLQCAQSLSLSPSLSIDWFILV